MLVPRTLAVSARAAREQGADAIVVTGTRTGHAPSPDELLAAREGAGDCPVLIGSGLAPDNARALLEAADGAIVGTSLMTDGRATLGAGGSAGRGARMKIVCAADCGIDRHLGHGIDRAGGIGLNVAVHARRQCGGGASVTLVAPVGDDAGRRARARRGDARRRDARASRSFPGRRRCSSSARRPTASASSSASTRACSAASA